MRLLLRRLRRNPAFALLNVFGLAVGLAAALLALFYIRDETRVDRFHDDADRLVQIALIDSAGAEVDLALSYPAGGVVDSLPEVERVLRTQRNWGNRLRLDAESPEVTAGIRLAEPGFFSFFSFPLASGSPASALAGPNDIVLTETTARALFGEADPVGQTVEFYQRKWSAPSQWIPLTVTAVALDPPPHTTIAFEAVARFEAADQDNWGDLDSWGWRGMHTYARLAPGSDAEAFAAGLPERLRNADPNNSDPVEGETGSVWGRQWYTAVSIGDVYFASGRSYGRQFTGHAGFMRLVGLIALAVLVIALLNYVNLATARGVRMAREVGVRKAVGAGRGQVMRQIAGEALLLVSLAFGLAVALVLLALPLFNTFFGKEVVLGWDSLPVWAAALALMLAVGLAAGAYPALVLSRFAPARVLRSGRSGETGGGAWLRRGLVVTQFAATIGLLVFTGFVFRQLDHVESRYPLPEDARLAVLTTPRDYGQRTPLVKSALAELPGVRASAAADGVPGSVGMRFGITHNDEPLVMAALFGDRDYLRVMRLPVADRAAPRASDPPFRLFVNESVMDRLGEQWRPDLHAPFELRDNGIRSSETSPIAGVLRDFPFESLRKPIEPLFFGEAPDTTDFSFVVAEVASDSLAAFQAALPGVWQRFTDDPPEPQFVDDYVAGLYQGERKLAQLVTLLAGVALLVACLGLFGLAAHAAQARRKEISVRKVLGAGVASLVGRLSREFALLVLAAFLIAAPLAYLATERWLSGFAERTAVGPGVFAGVLVAALVLALATVSYHAWTAATRNPADVLRDE